MDLGSIHSAQRFVRVAACSGHTVLGDPEANAAAVLRRACGLHADGVNVAVFPELVLTGYSIEDLVLQDALLDNVEVALQSVVTGSRDLQTVLVVGAPLRHRHRLYNCAVVVHRGQILGVVPKSYLPNYRGFYEKRWFATGDDERDGDVMVHGRALPFGVDLLFAAVDVPGLVLHAEICEDLWVPIPPSAEAALAGATVLANLSANPVTIGGAEARKLLCRSSSLRCRAAYVYATAGRGESTTDVAWDGLTVIYENGVLLAESERFPTDDRESVADIDLGLLRRERLRMGAFDLNRRADSRRTGNFRDVPFRLNAAASDLGLRRPGKGLPSVPADADTAGEFSFHPASSSPAETAGSPPGFIHEYPYSCWPVVELGASHDDIGPGKRDGNRR
jgi:NAD+ synthase (glutamine-hydrolysing)